MRYKDRKEAGQILSSRLTSYRLWPNAIVLGLARGGAVVAYEVAKALSLPFNVIVPRKIRAPDYPELALGAVAEDGEILLNTEMVVFSCASSAYIQKEIAGEKQVQKERLLLYRGAAPLGPLKGKTVLLIDDGVATGATLLVEIQSLKKQEVKRVVAASPVASVEAWRKIKEVVEEAVCPCLQENFSGISSFYDDFTQVEDQMILSLLRGVAHGFK